MSILRILGHFAGYISCSTSSSRLDGGQSSGNDCCPSLYYCGVIVVFYNSVSIRKDHLVSALKELTTKRTFAAIFRGDYELEVRSVTKLTDCDNFSFQLENRYASSIKGYHRWLFGRLEAEEHGGRHGGRGSRLQVCQARLSRRGVEKIRKDRITHPERAGAEQMTPRLRYSVVDIHSEKGNSLSLGMVQD